MQLHPRTFLQSGRLFYATLAVLCSVAITALAVMHVRLSNRYKRVCDGIPESWAFNVGWNTALHLNDYTNEIFAIHADTLASLDLCNLDDHMIRARLAKLEALPGVRHAYCLRSGTRLLASVGDGPAPLVDSLAERRSMFRKYRFGPDRYERKFEHWLRNRIRFEDVPWQGDTLRLILCGYDSTGRTASILPAAANPAAVQSLIALDLDPHWMKQAVAHHMEDVLYDREAFLMWTRPAWKQSEPILYGLGVIGLGDTLWWFGLKSVTRGYMDPNQGTLGPWFQCRAFIQLDQSDSTLAAAEAQAQRNTLLMGDAAAAVLMLLLISGLVIVRKQWLARQTALTHLAHAIRTPVARLRLDVDTLREKRSISPEEEVEVVQSIGTECGRIERAVQNAALSLNGNGHSLERTPGDLARIVEDALRPWETTFRTAGVTLVTPPRSLSLPGLFDREMIVTLLDNLLDNGLRHTRLQKQKNPRVTQQVAVGLRQERGFAELTVDDSDGGVPQADRQRIFRRFEKGSDAAQTGASGLGLGLALVKDIAEAHGGTVSVTDSELGGARFAVSLQLKD